MTTHKVAETMEIYSLTIRRPKVQDPGVCRVGPFFGVPEGRPLSQPLALAVLGVLWLVAASLPSLPPPSHGILCVLRIPLCICPSVSVSLLIKTPMIGFGPTLIQYDLL